MVSVVQGGEGGGEGGGDRVDFEIFESTFSSLYILF